MFWELVIIYQRGEGVFFLKDFDCVGIKFTKNFTPTPPQVCNILIPPSFSIVPRLYSFDDD